MVASFLRKSPKSRLCAITVCVASAAPIAWACSGVGTLITAPDLMRLILLLINASGLARSSATSIWSSETVAGLVAMAILLAVSPRLTVTWPSTATEGLAAAPAAGRTAPRRAGAPPFEGGGVLGLVVAPRADCACTVLGCAVLVAAAVGPAAPKRRLGGSNSMV